MKKTLNIISIALIAISIFTACITLIALPGITKTRNYVGQSEITPVQLTELIPNSFKDAIVVQNTSQDGNIIISYDFTSQESYIYLDSYPQSKEYNIGSWVVSIFLSLLIAAFGTFLGYFIIVIIYELASSIIGKIKS